ncbi:hypothetical protein A8C56_04810 [Niabella ginsenosidivorans]|uniref:IraD/Gp25-like domain-containing protein n=1 Tax=Niabella ginsenosidivorans TaxID=1176587 RepID=A0A1A9HYR3_9BACT|nr:GPW/gp25 family protein [Niabella ginsenosidivorans]ANH80393.1 hypothetical protein A8C56_04810 [Niabella ginsenosidivorans]
MNLKFPIQFDQNGKTAVAGSDGHIYSLIEQVLFTTPGERVNRPDFGSGLMQLVFEPNSDELVAATEFLVQGSLQQWLGDLIEVNNVLVENTDAAVQVTVVYTVRATGQNNTATFTR